MENRITLILGRKGEGKTTLARQLTAAHRRLFVLDPLSEYRQGLIFESVGALRYFFRTARPEFRCILRLDDDAEEEEALEIVWAVGTCCLLVEEADQLAPATGGSRTFRRLVKRGRHRRIDIVAVARRAAELSKLLRSQADEIVSFHQEEEDDLVYCAKRGFDPDALRALGVQQYLTNQHQRKVQQ